jgi:hypothetical protein
MLPKDVHVEYNEPQVLPTHAQMPVCAQWYKAAEIFRPRFKAIRTLEKAIARAPAKISYDWYWMKPSYPYSAQRKPTRGCQIELGVCSRAKLCFKKANQQQKTRKVRQGTRDSGVVQEPKKQRRSRKIRRAADPVIRPAVSKLLVMSRTSRPARRGKLALPDTYSVAVMKAIDSLKARQRAVERRLNKDYYEAEHELINRRQRAARASRKASARSQREIAASVARQRAQPKYEAVYHERAEPVHTQPEESLAVHVDDVQTKQIASQKETKAKPKTKKKTKTPVGPNSGVIKGVFTLADATVRFGRM